MHKTCIPSEAKVKVVESEFIETAIFEALKVKCVDRLNFVPFSATPQQAFAACFRPAGFSRGLEIFSVGQFGKNTSY